MQEYFLLHVNQYIKRTQFAIGIALSKNFMK